MRPHVISHIGASLDGRLDWGVSDQGLYYELVARFKADAMLSGSNTLLTAYAGRETPPEGPEAFEPALPADPADTRERLVVVDSRARLRGLWHVLRREPWWRDPVVLVSRATPRDYLDYLAERHVACIEAGDREVDLAAALAELSALYDVKTVRVDSGGILNGVLLRADLIDEVSVLLMPCLVGGSSARGMFVAPDLASAEGVARLKLLGVEPMRGDALWLRYEVVKENRG